MRLLGYRRSVEMRYALILLLVACCAKSSVDPTSSYTLPEPSIEFRSLELKRSKRTDEPDTLRLQLVMKDGDNDLGLNQFPIDPPYNEANAFLKSTGAKVDIATLKTPALRNDVIRYSDRKIHPFDTLPKFLSPYDCRNWNVNGAGGRVDTVYQQKNPYYYNIEVIYLIESASGSFEPFDFGIFPYPQCSNTFSGRFGIVDFKASYESGPRAFFPFSFLGQTLSSGILTYNMMSVGFHAPIWQSEKIKLRVNVIDRALHRSNIIETNIIQL